MKLFYLVWALGFFFFVFFRFCFLLACFLAFLWAFLDLSTLSGLLWGPSLAAWSEDGGVVVEFVSKSFTELEDLNQPIDNNKQQNQQNAL